MSQGCIIPRTKMFFWHPSPDDTVSASSNMDMEDRVSHLEQKLQLQEDEIQLLKSALADALRRLGYCEEQAQGMHPGGAGRRPLAAAAPAQPTKGNRDDALHAADESSVFLRSWICFTVAILQITTEMLPRIIDLLTAPTVIIWLSVRQLLQALPSRPVSNGYVQQKRLLSSPSSPRKETAQSIKRCEVHNMTLKLENATDSLSNFHFSIVVGIDTLVSVCLWRLLQEEYVHGAPHPGEEGDGRGEPKSNHLLQQLLWR